MSRQSSWVFLFGALAGYFVGVMGGTPGVALGYASLQGSGASQAGEAAGVGGEARARGVTLARGAEELDPLTAGVDAGSGRRGSSGRSEAKGGTGPMEEISAKLRESYEDLVGLRMSFRQVNSWADMPDAGEVSEGKLWAARGGRLRMEYTEPEGHLLVSDGGRVWVYVPENKQAVVDSVGPEGHSALAEVLLDFLEAGQARLLGQESVRGVECHVILMDGLEHPPGLESLKIWVDSRSWLARGLELKDLNDNVTTFTFWDIKRLKKIEDDLFIFEAPPGIEVVESPLGERGSR